MRRLSRLAAAALAAGLLAGGGEGMGYGGAGDGDDARNAQGPERILALASDVRVAADGSLRVTETVRIWATGTVFKHGLERIFPVLYIGPLGGRTEVGFQVEEVVRDGASERFWLRRVGRDVALRIGNAGTRLEPGEHRYEITYVTTRQLGFFADHDELYWNAVGTAWRVPIDAATATVTLPPAAHGRVGAVVAYIGEAGSRERAARAASEPDGAAFTAGRPLAAGEGMTIVVAWPKGVVTAPSTETRVSWWLHDNPEAVLALGGIILLAALVRIARARLVGTRAPEKWRRAPGPGGGGAPLPSVSPVLLRYVVRGQFDARSLPVAIMDMAERGCVTVHQGAHFALERTDKPLELLPSELQSAAHALFDGRKRVELAPSDRQWLGAAAVALKWDLDQVGESYVTDGRGPALLGLGLALAIVVAALGVATHDGFLAVIVGGWFGAWTIAFCALAAFLRGCLLVWIGRPLVAGARPDVSPPTAAAAVFFTALIGVMLFAIARRLSLQVSPLGVALLVGVLVIGSRALRLWRIRTAAGEELFAQARSLTRSLGATAAPPARLARPGVGDGAGVERLFAYALALDAVMAWEDGVSRLAGDGTSDPTGGFPWLSRDPDWDREHLRTGWPLVALADGFSSAVTFSAGPAPGTSSGGASDGSSSGSSSGWSDSSSSSSSDSGGSSGGGGGGGGGDGW